VPDLVYTESSRGGVAIVGRRRPREVTTATRCGLPIAWFRLASVLHRTLVAMGRPAASIEDVRRREVLPMFQQTNRRRARSQQTTGATARCRRAPAPGLPAALLIGVALAVPASASVTLYRDVDFRGRAQSFQHPIADLGDTAIGNDRASAVDVAPGCTAILYRDVDFRGESMTVRGALADLRHTPIGNDRVSSVDVRCRDRWRGSQRGWERDDGRHDRRRRWEGRDDHRYDRRHGRGDRYDRGGVVLYRDTGFREPGLEARGSIADLGRTPLGNDRLSSLSLPPACSAILYEDAHFRGRALAVDHDIADLRGTPIGNDRVSSVEVLCD